jgi:hypothetical protein
VEDLPERLGRNDAADVRAQQVAVSRRRFMHDDVSGMAGPPVQAADDDGGVPGSEPSSPGGISPASTRSWPRGWSRVSCVSSPPRSMYARVLPACAMAARVPRHSMAVTSATVPSQPGSPASSTLRASRSPSMPRSRLAARSEASEDVQAAELLDGDRAGAARARHVPGAVRHHEEMRPGVGGVPREPGIDRPLAGGHRGPQDRPLHIRHGPYSLICAGAVSAGMTMLWM